MKYIISFLTGVPKEKIDTITLRSIIIDILTIGLGTVILLYTIFDYRVDQDGVLLGSSLLVSGFLIRSWRKALNKN